MKSYFRHVRAALTLCAVVSATPALAGTTFVPPSDTTGHVYSTNSNDGYVQGRGVVFTPTSNLTLTNVAVYQDLTNVNLSYTLRLASATTGNVGGGSILSSGSQLATTSGLQFVDFALAPTTLTAGTYYFLDFAFNGNSNQNYFYDQSGAEPYSQAGFAGIDGTQGGSTSNFVLARIRLNGDVAAVPEPATWAMMLIGLAGIGLAVRRAKRLSDEKFEAKIKRLASGSLA